MFVVKKYSIEIQSVCECTYASVCVCNLINYYYGQKCVITNIVKWVFGTCCKYENSTFEKHFFLENKCDRFNTYSHYEFKTKLDNHLLNKWKTYKTLNIVKVMCSKR